jgi:hypothetical protein
MNISLLCKWWWRLENESGLWQDVVRAKYLQNATIGTVSHKMGDSPVWPDLLKVKSIYLRGRLITTKNGKNTLFWKDIWIGDKPLCIQALVLFDWCEDKDIIVYQFLCKGRQLVFNRWLPPLLFEDWLHIINKVYSFSFEECDDTIKWRWGERVLHN